MKKLFSVLTALVLLLAASAALADDDQLARILKNGKISIASEGEWSPWTYHDVETNELTGYDIDVGAYIASYIGVEPDFQEAEWSSLLTGLENGRFDLVINGVDYTEERAQQYDFSDPYFYSSVVLVVRDGNEEIKSVTDLAGKVTSNSPSSTYAGRAEAVGAEVIYADKLEETLSMVIYGRADATINARSSIEDYLSEHPEAPLRIVEELPGDPVCIPVRKGEDSASLLTAVNEALAAARADGTLSELSIKYFGEDRTNPE